LRAGTYDFGINLVLSQDEERVLRFVRWKFEDKEYSVPLGVSRGRVFYRCGYCPILWLPNKPRTAREYGTLCHEVFHVVCSAMGWAAIPLADSSEEAYAHLIGYLTTEILKKF
jgi:hypothetical protein